MALQSNTHRGVFPVEDDFGDVVGGMEQVVVPPLVPVDGHGPVLVHAGEREGSRVTLGALLLQTLQRGGVLLLCRHMT